MSYAAMARIASALAGFCLTAAVLVCAPGPAGTARADEAERPAAPLIWQSGDVTVRLIVDRPAKMPIGLFSGPATPEERAKYFVDGEAAAGINVFLIQFGTRNVLVDAGFGDAAPGKSSLVETLAALGLSPEDIDTVLITHLHMDHIGGLLKDNKRAFPKAKISASKPEIDYWLGLAEKGTDNANAALVKRTAVAYGTDLLPPFSLGKPMMPGITALDASGHTPGHTAFLLEIDGSSLLIIGDLVHAAALQFPLPDECARYDMDPAAAAAARKTILTLAAEKGIPVAGMHLPLLGGGTVAKDSAGFTLTPFPADLKTK